MKEVYILPCVCAHIKSELSKQKRERIDIGAKQAVSACLMPSIHKREYYLFFRLEFSLFLHLSQYTVFCVSINIEIIIKNHTTLVTIYKANDNSIKKKVKGNSDFSFQQYLFRTGDRTRSITQSLNSSLAKISFLLYELNTAYKHVYIYHQFECNIIFKKSFSSGSISNVFRHF